jgi:hypothetical protein
LTLIATKILGHACVNRCRCHGLVQAWEVGDHAVDAGEGEDAQNRRAGGDDQPQLAAVGQGAVVRPHQGAQPGRIAVLSAGHVHHERGVAAGGCFPQNRVQPVGVADIDFGGAATTGTPLTISMGYLAPGICATSRPGAQGMPGAGGLDGWWARRAIPELRTGRFVSGWRIVQRPARVVQPGALRLRTPGATRTSGEGGAAARGRARSVASGV